jgi:hypothetical protein
MRTAYQAMREVWHWPQGCRGPAGRGLYRLDRPGGARPIQDTNRLYSVGQFTGEREVRIAKAQNYALSRLRGLSPSATVTTTENEGVVRTRAIMETREIAQIGFLGMMIDTEMVVAAEHRVES